jgi:proteasome lid subunit RPN8/RPN11
MLQIIESKEVKALRQHAHKLPVESTWLVSGRIEPGKLILEKVYPVKFEATSASVEIDANELMELMDKGIICWVHTHPGSSSPSQQDKDTMRLFESENFMGLIIGNDTYLFGYYFGLYIEDIPHTFESIEAPPVKLLNAIRGKRKAKKTKLWNNNIDRRTNHNNKTNVNYYLDGYDNDILFPDF